MRYLMLLVIVAIAIGGVTLSSAWDNHDEAMKALDARDYRRAEALFTQALGERSLPGRSRALVLNNRAVAYYHLGQWDLMRRDLATGFELLPSHATLRRNHERVFAATAAAGRWEDRDHLLRVSGFRPEPAPLVPWWMFWRGSA